MSSNPVYSERGRFYEDADIQLKIKDANKKKLSWRSTIFLAYSTLGIVYGDIGTSPLYVFSSIFSSFSPVDNDILGATSMIFWSITLVVLFKYVFIVLRADDQGEGGTFALYTRLCRSLGINAQGTVHKHEEHQEVLQAASVMGSLDRKSRKTLLSQTLEDKDATHVAVSDRTLQQRIPSGLPALSTPLVGKKGSASSNQVLQFLSNACHWMPFPHEPVQRFFQSSAVARFSILSVSILATSMIIADGVLTPATSVTSAVSGLTIQVAISQNAITGISCAIIIILFLAQSFGTQKVSFTFSPVVVVWFMSIGGIGIYNMTLYGTYIWNALNPYWIYVFFSSYGYNAWVALGGVMLAVTGTEALFADLGHFSRPAIGIGFSCIAYPSLILAYLGQGAYLIQNPGNVSSAFWSSVPTQYAWPMLIIATGAATVASQALITGSFSIIRQAISMGIFPKVKVLHTGKEVEGQVYIGFVNYVLMILCVAMVAGFNGNGTAITNAYGICISIVMFITTNLITLLMVVDWHLSSVLVTLFYLLFGLIEGAFLTANLTKVPQGGWFTLAVGAGVALVKFGWLSGQIAKKEAIQEIFNTLKLSDLFSAKSESNRGNEPFISGGDVPLNAFSTPLLKPGPEVRTLVTMSRQRALKTTSTGGPLMTISRSGRLGSDLLSTTSVKLRQASALRKGQQVALAGSSTTRFVPSLASQSVGNRVGCAIAMGAVDSTHAADSPANMSTVLENSSDHKGSKHTALLPTSSAGHHLNSDAVVMEVLHDSVADLDNLINSKDLAGCQVLSKLRGIGLYYTDQTHGIPPVMWTFLRNVEAMHEFVILLQNRFLPIPFLAEEERLAAVPVLGVPNFYRVVARYGYMDKVDHGSEFAQSVVDFISGQLDGIANPAAHAPNLPPLSTASMMGRRTVVQARLADEADAADRQAAAEELVALRHAAKEGVVYYLGRTNVQMKDLSNQFTQALHDLWYGDFYRFMVNNSWTESEAWNIPGESMVELGINVKI
ncbi:hypothetical protein CEUSTIGMA_g12460.t1 [Chlamydomonas eustigma]|uniref:Potassium transporter n=1 Tax=Chlamydomonas eustigma TaxID=1157962 RepID=A0A250XQG5_9CHLO|nr:hypothetical protein CEUSTIGMA_g12460.t1 [Chlamydomonas eustigma]|eukprot:GAX85040.1 hypothetical protein CEUSTIGMA_g12460.t1 [Chlamydomonas eustigma]